VGAGEEEVQRRSDLYSFSRPAGIFKQSVGATNRVGMVVVPARQATQPGGIGSLESIPGPLKSLKYRLRQFCVRHFLIWPLCFSFQRHLYSTYS
jgi:hypothetical protein